MMTLVASCERHVQSATIDVGASIASTNAAIVNFTAKAESAASKKEKDFGQSEAELLDVPLSEQQFMDCVTVDSSCNGELTNNAFTFHKKSAMRTETSYSYTATQGTDTTSSCIVEIAQESGTGYKGVSTDRWQAPMSGVAQQHLSTTIEAGQTLFKSYSSGV